MADPWVERMKQATLLITALAALVGSIGGVVIGILNHSNVTDARQQIGTVQERQVENGKKIEDTQRKVEEVHGNIAAVKRGVDKTEVVAVEVKKAINEKMK